MPTVADLLTQESPTLPADCLCPGCHGLSHLNRETAADKDEFERMTGLPWPEGGVDYYLLTDRQTLGLKLKLTPAFDGIIHLCLPCAIAYMKLFNSLLPKP